VLALLKLDKPIRRRVQNAIDRLRTDPRPQGMKAPQGAPGRYRIRIGDHCVIYRIGDDRLVVLVVSLGHRREIYDSLWCPDRR
jgi:mRNA interferase RelE/StbE